MTVIPEPPSRSAARTAVGAITVAIRPGRNEDGERPEFRPRCATRVRPACRRGPRRSTRLPGTVPRGRCTRSRPTSPDGRRRAAPGTGRRGAAARGRRATTVPTRRPRSRGRAAGGEMPGSTARTYRPTGGARRRVSEWLPTASPNTTADATSRRSGPAVGLASQATSSTEEDGDEGDVQRVGLRLACRSTIDAGQGEADARHDAQRQGPGERPHEVDRDHRRDRDAQSGEQVHPEGRLAERAEQDVREPAQR